MILAVAAGGLGVALPSGCTPSNASLRTIAESEQIPLGTTEQAGDWLFWPTAVRFLPLSRSVASAATGARSLELFVECLDVGGHTTKATGHLVLELSCPTAAPPSRRLTIDLTDQATNLRLWDEVTGSYRIDVAAPFETPPAREVEIDCRVILFSANGSTPTATTRVKW